MKLERTKLTNHHYTISFNGVLLGSIERDVDGCFYWWDNKQLQGCTSSWALRDIADQLDELNAPYEASIEEYFKNNP